MSTLILDELYDGIVADQEVSLKRDHNLSHVRPWIYKHGTCTTTLTLSVLQDGTVLAQSIITPAEINAEITEDYFHGFLRFDFDALSLRVAEGNTEEPYTFRLEGSGGTDTNFVGIVRNWDLKIYDTYGDDVTDNQAVNDMIEPFGYELFEYKYT